MMEHKDLVLTPEYIKTRMQIDIYKSVKEHILNTGATVNDIAKNSGVDIKIVKDAIVGDFNGTLEEMVKNLVSVNAFPKLTFGAYAPEK